MTSITEELREYTAIIADKGSATFARLGVIADRIDAEYERRMEEAWRKGLMAPWDHIAQSIERKEHE